MVELSAHNGLVAGSIPARPTHLQYRDITMTMNHAKIQEILKRLEIPTPMPRSLLMLKDLVRYRGIGPEIDVYNRMTVSEGCEFLLRNLESPFPPEIMMDQTTTTSWTIDGKVGTQVQNGYSMGTVEAAKLVGLIETALTHLDR